MNKVFIIIISSSSRSSAVGLAQIDRDAKITRTTNSLSNGRFISTCVVYNSNNNQNPFAQNSMTNRRVNLAVCSRKLRQKQSYTGKCIIIT